MAYELAPVVKNPSNAPYIDLATTVLRNAAMLPHKQWKEATRYVITRSVS